MITTRVSDRSNRVTSNSNIGRYTVLGHQWRDGKYWRVVVQCECGNVKSVLVHSLGRTTFSCGCQQKDKASEAAARKRRKSNSLRKCQTCGDEFLSYRNDRDKAPQFCSHACRYPNGKITSTCENCGKEWEPGRSGAKFCSFECAGRAQLTAERKTIECSLCGRGFVAKKSHDRWPVFCSRECWSTNKIGLERFECEWCGDAFEAYRREGQPRCYCSVDCCNDAKSKKITFACESCGESFDRLVRHGFPLPRFCSKPCQHIGLSGESSPSYNGWKYTNAHGLFLWCDDEQKYRQEHRLVAEEIIGRRLRWASEPIWHINGIMDDNRPENLYIFEDHTAMQLCIKNTSGPNVSNLKPLTYHVCQDATQGKTHHVNER